MSAEDDIPSTPVTQQQQHQQRHEKLDVRPSSSTSHYSDDEEDAFTSSGLPRWSQKQDAVSTAPHHNASRFGGRFFRRLSRASYTGDMRLMGTGRDANAAAYDEDVCEVSSPQRRASSGRRGPLLAALLIGCCTAMSLHYGIPSTLWLYLSFMFIAVPASLAADTASLVLRLRSGQAWWTAPQHRRRRGAARIVWQSIVVVGLALWSWAILPVLFQPATFPIDAIVPASVRPPSAPIFIAANLYDSAAILPQFSAALLDVVDKLEGRVFVSLYESDSPDNGATDALLKQLDAQLASRNISRNVRSGGFHIPTTRHSGLSGNSNEPRESQRVGKGPNTSGRIQFLASVRNEALRPLSDGSADPMKLFGQPFRNVLWINDIVFSASDIFTLLATAGGKYDVACGFDFGGPLRGLYDTWVVRDTHGRRTKPLHPYFMDDVSIASLKAKQPIEVNSCWTGAASFDARWFTDATAPPGPDEPAQRLDLEDMALGRPQLKRETTEAVPAAAAVGLLDTHHSESIALDPVELPLRFRSSSACDSSECLLINLDIHRAAAPRRPRILMNPLVAVAYDARTYDLYARIMRWRITEPWTVVWASFIAGDVFGFLTDLGRKPASCLDLFSHYWAPPPGSPPRATERGTEQL